MPVPAAGAGSARRPARGDEGLRESLLARLRPVAPGEWQAQAAALLAGLPPNPLAAPPDGEDAWLGELPGPLLDEYIAATAGPSRPEPLAAGLWDRASGGGAGFAAGGAADDIPPGPVLAGLTADVCADGLARLADDELVGILRAGRRLASWAASIELAAAAGLIRRRMVQDAAAPAGQAGAAEHADAEIAAALTLTGRAAGRLLDLAMALSRLPLTARALAAGGIDVPRVMVIAEEVAGLAGEHITGVEERVLAAAAAQTTTQVRAVARRAVMAADPGAMRKRREQAGRQARVERWAEQAGTAALAGRDLPPTGTLAADQHLTGLARALRVAGAPGTMDQLRSQVFLALLTGQPVSTLLPPSTAAAGSGGPGYPSTPGSHAGPGQPGTPGPFAGASSPNGASSPGGATPGGPGPGGCASCGGGGAVAGMVNLTMPLGTWLGLAGSPGEVPGFGPLTAADSRALAGATAHHPRTRWCLTLTGHTGRPLAHGCVARRRGPPPSGAGPPPPRDGSMPQAGNNTKPPARTGNAGPPADGSSNTRPPAIAATEWAEIAAWVAGVPLQWLEAGQCAHRRESASYRPPPSLQHLIRVRQQLCAFPGCGRAAQRCDLDHTIPYHQGGRTCECNLAPLCRKHHQAKQAHGWRLEQPEPGTMTWTTPSGRRYTTCPSTYPK